jgi:L-lactate dehydrogenase complex protein LldE
MSPTPPTVTLFVTCLVDALFPNVGLATVAVLEREGQQVHFPTEQSCCGQPAFNAGHWAEARQMARHTLKVLNQSDGPIVLPSGSCTDMIRHHYLELFADDPVWLEKATAVSQRTFELSQFLVDELGRTDLKAECRACATYHPSCHGLRNLNLKTQVPALLEQVNKLDLRPLPEAEECCGFGGLFAVKMSDISGAMLERKLNNVEAAEVELLIGGDVSCLMHMAGGLQKRGSDIQVKHFAEVLADTPAESPTPSRSLAPTNSQKKKLSGFLMMVIIVSGTLFYRLNKWWEQKTKTRKHKKTERQRSKEE